MAKQLDELYSVRRFLNTQMVNMVGVDADETKRPVIYTSRPEADWNRPAFRIMNPVNTDMPVSKQWFHDKRSWVITYYAKTTDRVNRNYSREDASNVGEAMADRLRKLRCIPLYLFNFIYYPPVLREVTAQGTPLGAGTYSVQLLGEDLLGNITKLSPNASITIASGSAIDVQCIQHPMGMPLAKKIHVYLSGSLVTPAAAHRVGNAVMKANVDPVFRISADVANGQISGNALALAASLNADIYTVRYRYMGVELPVRSEIVQDPEEDDRYSATIRFSTMTPNVLDYDHSQTLGRVTVTEQVGG